MRVEQADGVQVLAVIGQVRALRGAVWLAASFLFSDSERSEKNIPPRNSPALKIAGSKWSFGKELQSWS